jgi:capsular polysaccharide transport system permease protein
MIGIRTFIRTFGMVAGVEMIPWMVIGLVCFFMFRDGMMSGVGAVSASKGLFAYRQLKPIDSVVIRVFTKGLLQFLVLVIFVIGMSFLGFTIEPNNILLSLGVFVTLWLFGLGVGLILSVVTQFVSEIGKIVGILSLPLMILSGAFLPIHYFPYSIQQYLLMNPILHGIELVRIGFFEGYWTLDGVNFLYLGLWVISALVLGLAMSIRFEQQLKAQ